MIVQCLRLSESASRVWRLRASRLYPSLIRGANKPTLPIAMPLSQVDQRNLGNRRVRSCFRKDARLGSAERKTRLMEVNGDPLRPTAPQPCVRTTIKHAVNSFLQDEEARPLAKTTTCQSKTFFKQQLLDWANAKSFVFLDQLTTADLREFRASWKNSVLTSQRKHHRLNGFFEFCIENELLTRNASKKMKGVQAARSH